MINKFLILAVLCLTFMGCKSQKNNKTFSSFDYDYIGKSELLQVGFVPDTFNILGSQKKLINKQRYTKILKDTVTIFFFNTEDKLLTKTIIVNTKKVDSALLFNKLFQDGYVKVTSTEKNAKFDLLNQSKNKRYNVNVTKTNIYFIIQYNKEYTKIPNEDVINKQ